jgi:transposase
MSWTEITRTQYRRDGLRYASDTTDEELALIDPHMATPHLRRWRLCGRETRAITGAARRVDDRNRQAVGRCQGFVLLPRRWVVERTLAWINRNRRLAKDFEKSIVIAAAWIMIASVKLITRRLTRA